MKIETIFTVISTINAHRLNIKYANTQISNSKRFVFHFYTQKEDEAIHFILLNSFFLFFFPQKHFQGNKIAPKVSCKVSID